MHLDSGEVLTRYICALGEDFGKSYCYAHSEWCDLWLTWKQFRSLFCSGPERVELLNRCGGSFFYLVDKLFLESTILAICRLTDPESTGSKQNLSVKRFLNFMDSEERILRMKSLLAAAEDASMFARDWRNRKIGHNDYKLRLGDAKPLEAATIEGVDGAIKALHNIFNYICREFLETETVDEVLDDHNNEMIMLQRLYVGETSFQLKLQERKVGKFSSQSLPEWLIQHD